MAAEPMQRAFVTGATGFIGGAVARELVRSGWRVRVLVRPGADERALEGIDEGRLDRHAGDLRDAASLRRGLTGCDILFHVAARYSLWNPRPREIYADNVDGTRNALAAARDCGIRRVVYTSTVGTVHLPGGGRPGDESRLSELDGVKGHYKRSKWLAEQEARSFARDGLWVTIVHPSAPIGPLDVKPTPTGQMVVDFLDGRSRAYTDTGLNIVAVEDVARGHVLAAERGESGESYILGGENMSLLEIFQALGELTGVSVPRMRIPAPALVPISIASELVSRLTHRTPLVPWEAAAMSFKKMYFVSSKAHRELGYEPGSARAALARAALWFYENGYVRRVPDVEVLDRLRRAAGNGQAESDAAS